MNAPIKPALRYHGAKFRLAPWVMQFFPDHTHYVEPFGGAAGVLLQKTPSYAEIYNDLDRAVVNFFRVLRDPVTRVRLIEQILLTPYARDEFELAMEPSDDPIEEARRLAIRAQMGFGSAGATKGHTGFRIDTKREYSTAQHLWREYPEAIAIAGQRLAGVLIENRPAVDVMRQHDSPTTLHYVDPPYLHATRNRGAHHGRYYRHELTDQDHVQMLEMLASLQGFVVLSGYPSTLYDEQLRGWSRYETCARISAGRGTALRNEVVWINPACQAALNRQAAQLQLIA
ncbi:MAG: DNA adenine methylase [Burkholderiaceae bacterium]